MNIAMATTTPTTAIVRIAGLQIGRRIDWAAVGVGSSVQRDAAADGDLRYHDAGAVDAQTGKNPISGIEKFGKRIVAEHARLVEAVGLIGRSEEHTSELQSLMRISYAVFCLNKKKKKTENQ